LRSNEITGARAKGPEARRMIEEMMRTRDEAEGHLGQIVGKQVGRRIQSLEPLGCLGA